jgi:hypothetical protein
MNFLKIPIFSAPSSVDVEVMVPARWSNLFERAGTSTSFYS